MKHGKCFVNSDRERDAHCGSAQLSSYDAGRYGEYWAAYDVPRHLWHFTPVTIQQLASRHGFIMAARHPMPFDAFYVSMLSEKHRGSSCSFLKGMYAGSLRGSARWGGKNGAVR